MFIFTKGEELTRGGGGKDPNFLCPYRFRTAWEYADVERLGWQWVYDHSANLICPLDPCSVVKCGFHASCTIVGDHGVCACDVGYNQGNPYQVNFSNYTLIKSKFIRRIFLIISQQGF